MSKVGLLIVILATIIYFVNTKASFEYENTLPQEPTSQLLDFFRHKLFYDKHLITKEHQDGYIYQEGIIHDPRSYISYAFSPTEKVYEYYDSRLKSEEEHKYAYKKVNSNSYLEEIYDPIKYGLPNIKLIDGSLTIETSKGELTLSTIQINDDELDFNKVYYISVIDVNDDAFYLNISENKNDDYHQYILFVKQDLTDYQLIEKSDAAFEQFMRTEQFSLYNHLFLPIDDEERYLSFYIDSQHQEQVIDTKSNTLVTIGGEDYLSEDGKYVYLSGKHNSIPISGLSEGDQYIQTLEDYIAGNNSHEMTFNLDYKVIKKAANIGGIGTKVSDTHRKVVYFNEELIIIHITYDAAFFGIAGTTNVVVDFYEDKENPQIYILDLSAS